MAGQAQSVSLSFTGRNANTGTYVQLSRVEITNQTRGWTDVLFYPDSVATLTDGTGIDDNAETIFGLSQNTPNPFSGTTYVSLSLPEDGAVSLEVCDLNGRAAVSRSFVSMQPGTHVLRVNLAASGVYLLTARQCGKVSTVRMINQHSGGESFVELVGLREIPQTKGNGKGVFDHPFAYGDSMIYKGYATISGLEFESETVAQTQLQPETITLYFSAVTLVDGESCPGTATVTDHEGNIYNTVQIGNQCWMKENMRCTTSPSTGTSILESSTNNTSYTGKKAYYVNGDSANTATYGLLYNWNAAIDMYNMAFDETSTNTVASNAVCVIFSGHRRGICPAGWHLPSDTEWVELTTYVYENGYKCPECSASNTESSAGCIAKALASQTGWDSDGVICAVGNDSSANNTTGFSGLPAGIDGTDFGHLAYYWSSTQSGIYGAFERNFNWHSAHVHRHSYDKYHGFSVRCIRGENPGSGGAITSPPSVTTGSVSYFTATTATCSSTVTTDGSANVTARGVCWGTLHNPTVSNSHSTDGTGAGSFSSSLTGLTAGTTYYVRAYATNNDGTAYGAEVSFTTISPTSPTDGEPCPGIATVTDHEGNVYHTVQIGDQCWVRENMRCTTSPSTGTSILEYSSASGYSYTGKKAYFVNGDSANTATYGLLYNWNAAVDTFNATYGEISTNLSSSNAVIVTFNSHRRGICPAGWHLPSDAEWTLLTTYVYNNGYQCSGCSGSNTMYYVYCIAKALASRTGWNSSGYTCEVGNNPSSNNNTGFTAVPAGYCFLNYPTCFGALSHFWSATQVNSGSAYGRSFGYESEGVSGTEDYKSAGFSVRCVRD